nr:hypothetical protein [Pseudomonas sp. BIGb0427]
MSRVIKFIVLGLLALLLLLVLGVGLVLGTQAGSRWALGLVPGLQLDNFQGRLAGQWQAERLLWEQGGDRVELVAPALAWSPACLLRMTLCIERLETDQVNLAFTPGEPKPDSGPLQLPQLKLPLAIELGSVRIGQLRLDGNEQLSQLQLAAHWTTGGLQIDSLQLQRDDLKLNLQGLLKPEADWPLQAQGQLQLPSVDGQPLATGVAGRRRPAENLKLTADSSGYLQARLSGELQALAQNLPAQLQISSEAFKPSAALPDTLQLNQLQLSAKGNLQNGYQLLGSASLPAEQGPVALKLQGRVDAKGAEVSALDLSASAEQALKLKAKADWQQGLSADASIDWLDFPWLRLYPMNPAPEVSCAASPARCNTAMATTRGEFNGDLDGPAGTFSLSSPFKGDLKQVSLAQLQLSAGQGKATGSVGVQFADGVAWDAALELSALNPAYWLAELPGTLAGPPCAARAR